MIYYLFRLATGIFTGRTIEANDETREANCPAGSGWAAGVNDWQSQRVDTSVHAEIQELEGELTLAEESDDRAEQDAIHVRLGPLRGLLLVDYIPPQPSPEYEWHADRKRWVLSTAVAEQRARSVAAMAEIEALERASLRPLREVRLAELDGRAAPDQARARLVEIEARIAELRPDISADPG